jgi:hypothetical protein
LNGLGPGGIVPPREATGVDRVVPSDRQEPDKPAEPPAAPSRMGLIRGIANDYKAVASLVGLLVYGIVRVSYDAYYTRLGVFPEAVGLTEATILGRAVLYLALSASIAAIVGGLWFGAVRVALPRFSGLSPLPLAAVILVPALGAAALVAVSGKVRELLVERDFAYYCIQRCKFQPLEEHTLTELRGIVARNAGEHPSWDVTELGPAWLVALPLVFFGLAAGLAFLFDRRDSALARQAPVGVFAALAVASLASALLAPHLQSTLRDAREHDPSAWLLQHQSLLWWTIFGLLLLAVGGGLLAVGARLGWQRTRGSPWPIASFIVVLPLLLGFGEATIPRFLEEEGLQAVLAAIALWVVLLSGSFLVWPQLVTRRLSLSPAIALFVALVISLTLFLAWERGLNLAKRAAMGDQIYPQRFGILSVRANVVCLEQSGEPRPVFLRPGTFTYLGQANGTLILYDYRADLANETPTAWPVRLPAGDAVVRLAQYDSGRWSCGARTYFVDGFQGARGLRGHLVGEERAALSDPSLGRIVADLLRGPSPTEREERGLATGFAPDVRLSSVHLENETATVALFAKTPRRRWPDAVYATAQLVYTLTELPDVEAVVMTVNGAPCCLFQRNQPVTTPLTRGTFAKWQGAPVESD